MKFARPFIQDPSSTAAFAALRQTVSSVARAKGGRRLKAVVIGGGTGAPVSIRTLLSLGLETSAVVAMADDGGSTGLLREEADVTPPGDVRKCIAAMARNPEDPLVKAFRCRLEVARNHTLGNLMLAALEDASGSFPEAVSICERLVDAQGHVYPSTLDHVTLVGRTRDDGEVRGQVNVCHAEAPLKYVFLESEGSVRSYEPALRAIREADLIVLGPGSLFTSVIPNLLVPGVVEAIRASRGRTLFVCSLADMQGETKGLTACEHVEALLNHGMQNLLDYVLLHDGSMAGGANSAPAAAAAAVAGSGPAGSVEIRPVSADADDVAAIESWGPAVIVRSLVDPQHPTWHHPQALRDSFEEVLKKCRSRQR